MEIYGRKLNLSHFSLNFFSHKDTYKSSVRFYFKYFINSKLIKYLLEENL